MFTFIRHNRLKSPYDDYSKLSLDELEKLASGEVDPSTQEFVLEDIKDFDPSIVLDADVLLCSESSRSRETLELILKLLGIDKEIVVEPLINEISFSPKKLVVHENEPLKSIRENFVSSLYDQNSGSEQVDDIKNRVENLNNKYEGKTVFGVCHGFFLGVWREMNMNSVSFDTLDRVDYLETLRFKNV